MHQVQTHQHRNAAADQPGNNGKNQIQRTDIFMVRGTEPAREETHLMAVVIVTMAVRVISCLMLVRLHVGFFR
jgi:hypothetical protein